MRPARTYSQGLAMIADVFQLAAELSRANCAFALVHLLKVKGSSPGKSGFKMLVQPQGLTDGTIGGGDAEFQMIKQAREALAEGKSRTVEYALTKRPDNLVTSLCGGTNEVFIEVFMPKPCILILGAGHVAQATARVCAMLDYAYVVVDDREDYALPKKFAGALDVVCMRGGAYLQQNNLPAFSHVIGLGYDAPFDLEGIIPALKKLPNSVKFGAIGSKAKYMKMSEIALEMGATVDEWQRVKCPVGLEIGAQTPAEIAVSIMAEVVGSLPGRESAGWKV
ncbi:XdhC/CoxI family protein [Planctomycetota bacterium]|nr:XdhC/CoxI family protein [Planctomycetota bacterium]